MRTQRATHSSPRKAIVLMWVLTVGLSPGSVAARLRVEDKSSGRRLGAETVEVKAGRDGGPGKR